MFSHFYNESIRKLVVGFGGLFNQIQIHKFNSDGSVKEKVLVPISYGPKEKFIRRIRNMSSISEDVKIILSNTTPPDKSPNTSGTPPTGVETQGNPADIASKRTSGKPSDLDGII